MPFIGAEQDTALEPASGSSPLDHSYISNQTREEEEDLHSLYNKETLGSDFETDYSKPISAAGQVSGSAYGANKTREGSLDKNSTSDISEASNNDIVIVSEVIGQDQKAAGDQNPTVDIIEQKIAKLSREMKEGMDQINYVNSLKEEEKKKRQESSTSVGRRNEAAAVSPVPTAGGHRPSTPAKKPISDEKLKEMKKKIADEFIQVDYFIPGECCGSRENADSAPFFFWYMASLSSIVRISSDFMEAPSS